MNAMINKIPTKNVPALTSNDGDPRNKTISSFMILDYHKDASRAIREFLGRGAADSCLYI